MTEKRSMLAPPSPKLIAVDLDRTLLRNDGTLSSYTQAVIAACLKQGIGFTLATGRMYLSALPIAQKLALTLPLITYQGALLKNPQGETLHRLILEENLSREIAHCLRQSGVHYNIYEDDHLYISTQRQDVLDYAAHIGIVPRIVPQNIGSLPVTEFGVFGTPKEVHEIKTKIERLFGDAVSMVTSGDCFLEICHSKASKGLGLEKLAEFCGFEKQDIIAIGDSNNDLDMLTYAGLGLAVANAIPAAKACCDKIIGCNEEDGVARFIAAHVLGWVE